jgi:type IV secretory pathway VirB10-like protein
LNRPATIEIRPGYQFDVMVTQDLVFPGPYAK